MTAVSADPTSARWRAVSSEFGIAALRHTHWLDTEPRTYDGTPGTWAARDGAIIGSIPEHAAEHVLRPGEAIRVGQLELRAFSRDGALALRVIDPDAPSRRRLRGILSYPRQSDWVLHGTFEPASDGETRVVRSVDGHERTEVAVGVVALSLPGEKVRLTVSAGASGLQAVIADATSGDDAYRFRFLPIDAPNADGEVTVDFNRAYLPPCAFSDQYVCPLPPAGNRLSVRIEAGERLPDVTEGENR